MQGEEDDQWVCPSFNTYSSNTLADIVDTKDNDHDGDFEFSLVRYDDLEASGEETFFEEQSQRPIFPLFNRGLLNSVGDAEVDDKIEVSLEKLLMEKHEEKEVVSSSETEEEEDIPCRRYCIWRTNTIEESPNRCNKSKSTGFVSKRFRLRDLLRRSNSEGKDSFLFLTTKKNKEVQPEISDKTNNNMATENSKDKTIIEGDKNEGRSSLFSSPSRRKFNSPLHKMPTRGDEMLKRKTYLPYRQDLVGFFTGLHHSK